MTTTTSKVTVLVEFNGIVRTASSNSIAQEEELKTKTVKRLKRLNEKVFTKFLII
jgi:hypothetical protein